MAHSNEVTPGAGFDLAEGAPWFAARDTQRVPSTTHWRSILTFAALLLSASPGAVAKTKPTGPTVFFANYPDAPACAGRVVNCDPCHDQSPPWLNQQGMALGNSSGADPTSALEQYDYDRCLPATLAMVSSEDSDRDRLTNLEELERETMPGDQSSVFLGDAPPTGAPSPGFDLGRYDPRFVLSRLIVTYCGFSPSCEDTQALAAQADKASSLRPQREECTASDWSRREALYRIADPKFRPEHATGLYGDFILADCSWGYQLFSFVILGSGNAREPLTATYRVDASERVVEGLIEQVPGSKLSTPMRLSSGQPSSPLIGPA